VKRHILTTCETASDENFTIQLMNDETTLNMHYHLRLSLYRVDPEKLADIFCHNFITYWPT